MIPDFRLVHADGREYLLEIVGWMIEAAGACGW
jgi:predicted nuclease of restriction endonuclease-like RecB superfamily